MSLRGLVHSAVLFLLASTVLPTLAAPVAASTTPCTSHQPPPGITFSIYERFVILGDQAGGCPNWDIDSWSSSGALPPGMRIRCGRYGFGCILLGFPFAPGTFRFSVTGHVGASEVETHAFTIDIAPPTSSLASYLDFDAAIVGTPVSRLRYAGVTLETTSWYVIKVPEPFRATAGEAPAGIPWPHPDGNALIAVDRTASLTLHYDRPIVHLHLSATGTELNGLSVWTQQKPAICTYSIYATAPPGAFLDCPVSPAQDTFTIKLNQLQDNVWTIVDNIAAYSSDTAVLPELTLTSVSPPIAPPGSTVTVYGDRLGGCTDPIAMLSLPVGVLFGNTSATASTTGCDHVAAIVPQLPDGPASITIITTDGRSATIPFTVGSPPPHRHLMRR